MLPKTDECAPLKSRVSSKYVAPGECGTPSKMTDEECHNSLSYCKSVRIRDGVDMDEILVNQKTFMSFADPEQMLWGGSYYEKKQLNPNLNEQGRFESLQFRSENPLVDDTHIFDMKEERKAMKDEGSKFGTWDGVFASCLLNIFGVIMFLRLPWVVGQAGILCTLVIIGLSGIVVLLTSMSMAAIVTNGKIEEGGAYFMISRTLGPGIGGAIGVLFSIGLAVAVSMYVIGFCETMIGMGLSITGDVLNDIRISGIIILTICLVCVMIGIGWVVKLQLFLLFLLLGAIASFFIGSFLKPVDTDLPFVAG